MVWKDFGGHDRTSDLSASNATFSGGSGTTGGGVALTFERDLGLRLGELRNDFMGRGEGDSISGAEAGGGVL